MQSKHIKITEPSLRNVQEKDLRALGRVLGAIYAGAPCPAQSEDTPSSVSGLFNKSPMKSISDGLFDDIDPHKCFSSLSNLG